MDTIDATIQVSRVINNTSSTVASIVDSVHKDDKNPVNMKLMQALDDISERLINITLIWKKLADFAVLAK